MKAETAAATEKLIFRCTNTHTGRHISVNPNNSSLRLLAYGRIILNGTKLVESLTTGDRETGLIFQSREATVKVDENKISLGQYDSIYVPRDSTVQISTDKSVDMAEFSAEVSNGYPLQVVRFAEISRDPSLKFNTGGSCNTRYLHLLLAKHIQAGRLIVGFTESEPGNWTSWPPHEHAAMLEELYVYFNMPHPAYGIQLVYNDPEYPDLVTVVREGDAVLLPRGFHPKRFRARTPDLFSLGDGRSLRGRRPAVRRGQRAARL
jgi:5-deoxy-glucuronate isomerase